MITRQPDEKKYLPPMQYMGGLANSSENVFVLKTIDNNILLSSPSIKEKRTEIRVS